ncbi:MAG: PAS domain S-box protein [Bacteroidetes bacterium]|nr:PAS domain S-box protein [Bacteroidota bacterium]
MMKRSQISDGKLIIFFIVIIGILSYMGLFLYKLQRVDTKAEKYAELSAIASLKTEQLINYRNERLRDAAVISKNEFFIAELKKGVTNPGDQNIKNRIVNYIHLILQNYEYKGIIIADTSGHIYITAGYELSTIGDTTISFLKTSMRQKQITMSDIYLCNKCADIHLDVFAPVFSDEKLLGGIIYRIDPNHFLYPLIQSWPTPSKTSESLLIRKDGNEVVFLNKLRHTDNTVLKLRFKIDSSNIHIPAVAATYGYEGLMEGIDYREIPVLSDIRKIPGSPWWMIVKVDLDEVYTDMRDKTVYLSSIGAVLVLFFASGFFWLRNNQKKTLRIVESQKELELNALELASRKKTEEALRIKNWVFDVSSTANSIADTHGVITEVNESFLKLWNYPDKKEVIGKTLSYFIQNLEEEEIINKLNKNGNWEGSFTAKKKDGSTFIGQSMATTIHDETGSVIGYQSVVFDETQRKKLEEEIKKLNIELEQRVVERTQDLESSQEALLNIVEDLNEKSIQLELSSKKLEDTNKELESFSYSVSHDLRAPLRALDGFSKILLEDYESVLDSEGKRYLNIIKDNATNMGELIDDLLKFSRLNKQEIQPSKIDMFDLAKSIYEETLHTFGLSDAEFKIEELPEAYGDYAMVKQVWRNLLGNSIKYRSNKENLVLEIGYTANKTENVYFVKDNGVGFDMAYKDKLFGVFQRLHSKKEFEGTGVGLAIVQRIIHRMGGRVWAEAEVNKGATFYFTLPNKIN